MLVKVRKFPVGEFSRVENVFVTHRRVFEVVGNRHVHGGKARDRRNAPHGVKHGGHFGGRCIFGRHKRGLREIGVLGEGEPRLREKREVRQLSPVVGPGEFYHGPRFNLKLVRQEGHRTAVLQSAFRKRLRVIEFKPEVVHCPQSKRFFCARL